MKKAQCIISIYFTVMLVGLSQNLNETLLKSAENLGLPVGFWTNDFTNAFSRYREVTNQTDVLTLRGKVFSEVMTNCFDSITIDDSGILNSGFYQWQGDGPIAFYIAVGLPPEFKVKKEEEHVISDFQLGPEFSDLPKEVREKFRAAKKQYRWKETIVPRDQPGRLMWKTTLIALGDSEMYIVGREWVIGAEGYIVLHDNEEIFQHMRSSKIRHDVADEYQYMRSWNAPHEIGAVTRKISFRVSVPPSGSMEMSIEDNLHVQEVMVELARNEKILFRYLSQTNRTGFLIGSERYLNGRLNGVSMYRKSLNTTFCVTFTNGVAEGPYSGTVGEKRYRGIIAGGNICDGVSWHYDVSSNIVPEILVYSNATVVSRAYDISRIEEFSNSDIPRIEFDLNSSQLSEAYYKMAEGDRNAALLLYKHSVFLTSKRLLSDLLLTVSALLGNREADEIYKTLSEKNLIRLEFSKDSLLAMHDHDKTTYMMILDFAQKIDLDDYTEAEIILWNLEAKEVDDIVVVGLKTILRTLGDFFTLEEWEEKVLDD